MLFGCGPQSTSLAQSDLADAESTSSAYTNPALLARQGVAVALGYGHGWTHLTLSGKTAPVRDISGTDVALQLGGAAGKGVTVGWGMAMHLPDRSLARIAFSPGSEPLLLRFEPSGQTMTFDSAVALRYGPLAVGVGVSVLPKAGGEGVDLALGQDGNGAYADSKAELAIGYHAAPTAGAVVDLGSAALALRYRGAQSIGVEFETRANVNVTGNPLNGTTAVTVRGTAGYEPATVDLATRITVAPGVKAFLTLQYARWSAAPSPTAQLSLDVKLGLVPGQLEGNFVQPRLRDTISPRLGLEVHPGGEQGTVALRAGYLFSPSPVPRQTGFSSQADAPMHGVSLGAGLDLGRLWGVALRVDAAAQLLVLQQRAFDKPSELLPFAHYTAGGSVAFSSIALQGAWR
jgi:hypothetical protein